MPSPCYPVYLAFNKSMHLRNIFYQYNSNGIDVNILHFDNSLLFKFNFTYNF